MPFTVGQLHDHVTGTPFRAPRARVILVAAGARGGDSSITRTSNGNDAQCRRPRYTERGSYEASPADVHRIPFTAIDRTTELETSVRG